MKVVLATTNAGKVREVRAILSGSGIEVDAVPLFIGDEEHGVTYLENALAKAMAVRRLTGRPVLAEDSGLEVDALGGLPGVRSARFAGPAATDATNNAKLLRLLEGVPDRTARYRSVAVLLGSSSEVVGEGTYAGRVAQEPRGAGGFGYDPVFVPDSETRTVAELSPEEKDAISHRGRALRQLVERLG